MRYYVDTCIWLNLLKKEGDPAKGVPYWKLARDFIESVLCSEQGLIVYSDIVLRELKLKLEEHKYHDATKLFVREPKCIRVDVTAEDKAIARKLESHYDFTISFYDMAHLALCKRLSCALVTRDKQLAEIARENGVKANRPEEITIGADP